MEEYLRKMWNWGYRVIYHHYEFKGGRYDDGSVIYFICQPKQLNKYFLLHVNVAIFNTLQLHELVFWLEEVDINQLESFPKPLVSTKPLLRKLRLDSILNQIWT